MTLIEGVLKDHVFIDFGCEVIYGDDQIYLDNPTRFVTVGFQLISTNLLSEIVDRIRKEQGFKPFHPMDEYTDDTCDNEGWYDFYVSINDWDKTKVDTCIEAIVCNSRSADEGETYTIDLTTDEQTALYNRLDEQCRQYLGKSCAELLAESRQRMEE